MNVTALTTIKHGGVRHKPGAVFDLPAKVAQEEERLGHVAINTQQRSGGKDPASADTDPAAGAVAPVDPSLVEPELAAVEPEPVAPVAEAKPEAEKPATETPKAKPARKPRTTKAK